MTDPKYDARLIYAASEIDADLFYATRFLAPDAFIFLDILGEKIILISDLELDRAKEQAQVDSVLSLSKFQNQATTSGIENPTTLDALQQVLQERNIRNLSVPPDFPVKPADILRESGYNVGYPSDSFFPQRERKTAHELACIREVQRHTESAMDVAIGAIRDATIKGDSLYQNGKPLTSESVKRLIATKLMLADCTAQHTIVACGDHACNPHHEGSGPLFAHQPIILDIFPRSNSTGYFADITRTVIKGSPTPELTDLYNTVLNGQQLALASIRSGINGKEVHRKVVDLFESKGYKTSDSEGRMQGYFHGTGHGVGLEIHEPPRISKGNSELETNHVVTVEPGLYYPGTGAVRIEDLVVVTENGCENLTSYPKNFVI